MSAPPLLGRRGLLGAAASALVSAAPLARAAAILPPPARMPLLFVSHGSPRLAIDAARYEPLRQWGASLPRPRGIVAMTPHFASRRLLLGSTKQGFAMYNLPGPLKRQLPQDLEYATPPSAALADAVEARVKGAFETTRVPDRRGFDHTTWIPLRNLYPKADVPVLELGYPYLSDQGLFDLGRTLAPMRDDGYVFFASGGVTHNLAAVDFTAKAQVVPAWSKEFDAWAAEALEHRAVDALVDWRHKAPAAELAHPDDGAHFRVLLVALGIAAAAGGPARTTFPVVGYEMGMSTRCIEIV